ncbi:hypothetical protein EJ05DRAFT_506286 [Pseudovirgaria hyperparasitica]|uniref:25S rRNA (Uridine(2843)-N(3))-methyltransferase n=1 Tax=Pseudovirgaria hyperparasitica TaxID=470096 RepID=A0A6A6WK72_9PEZI|nr:uncharacterized protein EJ05DRAFT_506286 [Pseudovirgaria hyperparasitica]KAF2762570.1 hypothetical protein EJ05DRAFT_506286 [Pseudovirgaria hyperparasitica]
MPVSKNYNNASKSTNAPRVYKVRAASDEQQQKQTCNPRTSAAGLPLDLQQLVLNIFRSAFSERLSADISPLLQEIKQHLYERNFTAAFGQIDYLEAYAARWSPSRALGYLQVLHGLQSHLIPPQKESWKIACLGGGAGAEIVALAGSLRLFFGAGTETPKLDIQAVDVANWSCVIQSIQEPLTKLPPQTSYISSCDRKPFIDLSSFNTTFHHMDLLSATSTALRPIITPANLITILFTLNELYSTSMQLTQSLLLHITSLSVTGTLLLVVDSPGSYSTVKLGKEGTERKYPMQWLLEHMLLESASGVGGQKKWEQVISEDSVWFRLDKRLKYPMELENMRYQMHLYRRL